MRRTERHLDAFASIEHYGRKVLWHAEAAWLCKEQATHNIRYRVQGDWTRPPVSSRAHATVDGAPLSFATSFVTPSAVSVVIWTGPR